MMLMTPRTRVAMVAWTVVTLSLMAWSVSTGGGTWRTALLLVLFAGPLGVAYALGVGAVQQTVGQMLHNRPKDPQ
jgi:hypothetical protein